MNTKDLMIGNWICIRKHEEIPMQISSINTKEVVTECEALGSTLYPSVEDIRPIEVTDNILENSGFKLAGQVLTSEKVYKYSVFHFILNKMYIQVKHDSPEKKYHCLVFNLDGIPVGQFCFDYVHELQNGIRLITKQDLDVKP